MRFSADNLDSPDSPSMGDEEASQSSDAVRKPPTNTTGHIATAYYLIVVFAIGIPIWIRTTSPSRYSLPDIASLMVHSQLTTNQIEISVVVAVDLDKEALKARLPSNHRSTDGQVAFQIDWKVRKMTPKEEDAWSKSKSIAKFDELLAQSEAHRMPGKLYIVLVDMNLVRSISRDAVVFGSNRCIYVGVRDEEMSVLEEYEDKSLIDIIMGILETVLEDKHEYSSSAIATEVEIEDERESIKSLLHRDINVLINFIPESIEDIRASSMLQEIQRLQEFFVKDTQVSQLLSIRIMSQNVYRGIAPNFIDLNSEIAQQSKKAERHFDISNLALLLNSIESRIVEPNNRQNYHLHVIIPSISKNITTLFYDGKSKSRSFAAATSYRAGVFFWNQADDFNLAFKSFMRSLLGLSSVQPRNSLRRNIFLAKWELDYIIRKMTLLQLAKILTSLESIEKLLSKVKNIVILEDIASKMNTAADLSHEAIDLLAAGNLSKAFHTSSRAYLASESAFFDSSLLSQLYFPEDQKYAVYLPLFLPVALPLIYSWYKAITLYYHKLGSRPHEHQE